nr:unnamed protein product [Callosobruchus analis]
MYKPRAIQTSGLQACTLRGQGLSTI